MGEVIPGEYITNVLHKNKHTQTVSFLDHKWVQMWEDRVKWKLVVDCPVVVSIAIAETIRI